jgi:GH43 family beta-xylosidase
MATTRRRVRLGAVAATAAIAVAVLPSAARAERAAPRPHPAAGATFTNPVRQHISDPHIIKSGSAYYMTSTDGCDPGYLCVWKSPTITGLATAPKYPVFRIPGGQINSTQVWAPEIHEINGAFYIYYTAANADNGDTHRMFVLRATTSDPTGPYAEAATGHPHGQLYEPSDQWAIDPDVFTGGDGRLYAVWSGWQSTSNRDQRIYIAPMSDPLHISGNRVEISAPTRPWETVGTPDGPGSSTVGRFPVNEGPVGFGHGGKTFITFSASFCGTRSYAVGLLSNSDGNLLSAASWKKTGPVFKYHGNAIGTASFAPVTSPDGTEDWFVYHANTNGCDPDRVLRAQRLHWDARDGSPLLGYPVNSGVALPVPSGEAGSVAQPSPYASGWGDAFGDAAEGDTSSGRRVGTWSTPDTRTASLTSFGGTAWTQLFYASNPDYENYTVSADTRWRATGSTSAFPKYGIYASYADKDNHVEVFIDRQYNVLATHARVQGVDQPWQNSNLPAGFDPTVFHTLKVVKSGAVYTFSLDGVQQQQRTFTGATFPVLLNGQPGLVTEDTQADYRNVAVTNTQ